VRKAAFSVCYAAVTAYVATGALLWTLQNRLIFEPARSLVVKPAELAFTVADLAIPVGSAEARAQALHAWWMPAAKADAKVLLYFHGNDGNISTRVAETALLRELGHSVLLVDYRGYGESDGGFPSEATVYEDAEAALAFLVDRLRVKPRDLYLYGHSLGAAVAIDLAAKHAELGGLIVESGFTSIYDMAQLEPKYAIFPVSLLLNQRFESLEKVSRLALPVLYIHGTADDVVPFAMGRALFERSGGRKRFLAVEGGRHEDNASIAAPQLCAAIRELLEADRPTLRVEGQSLGLLDEVSDCSAKHRPADGGVVVVQAAADRNQPFPSARSLEQLLAHRIGNDFVGGAMDVEHGKL
jgi:fermentation-respiration switch protein FrsA (DUF1100 family)